MAEGGTGLFYTLGTVVARFPSVFVAVGIVTTVALATGLIDPPFESDLDDLWIEEGGRLDNERDYTDSHEIPGTRTTTELWTTIAQPEGNVLTSEVLTDHLEAARSLYEMTIEVDGISEEAKLSVNDNNYDIKFDFNDICRSGASDYVIQCLRVTELDCFSEGNFDLPTSPTNDTEIVYMAVNVLNDPVALETVSQVVEGQRDSLCDKTVGGDPYYDFGTTDMLKILCGIMDGIANPLTFEPYDDTLAGSSVQLAGPVSDPSSCDNGDPSNDAALVTPCQPCIMGLSPGCVPGYTLVQLKDLSYQLALTAVTELISLGYVFQGDEGNANGAAYSLRPSFEVADATTIESVGSHTVAILELDDNDNIVPVPELSVGCYFWDNGAILPAVPRDIVLGRDGGSDFVAFEFVVYAVEAEALVEKLKSPW